VESVRHVVYVIGNGASTLNAYASPVDVNPTHTRAFLMVCGLGVLFAIDVLAFGVRRPPLVALPLLVTLSVPVSILNNALALPVFVGVALLFMRLLAVEHVDKLWSWGGHRAARPRLTVLWQVSVAAVLVALVVAPLVPVADLLNRKHAGLGNGTGGGGQFQLTTVNPFIRLRRDLVAQTHTPLVYAETDATDTSYLRTTVLDQFRDDEWRPSPRDLPRVNSADGPFPNAPGLSPGVLGETSHWKLQLAPDFGTTWLPLPYPVRSVKVAGSWRYDSDTLDVAYVGGSSPAQLSYQATAFTPRITAKLLDGAPTAPTRLKASMTALPDNLPPVVEERAKEVTRGATTNYQKAVKLQDWFRSSGGFTYSLAQRSGSGMDLLADFITNDRIGYCEQFAAAMAAMGRTLGIPSRVVVGFLHGTAQTDGRVLYTSDDRHAWPEMYFGSVGWVRFEPTPGSRAGATPVWTRQDINTADPSAAPSAATAPTKAPDPSTTSADTQSSDNGAISIPWWPVAGLGLLVLVVVGPGVVRRQQRRRRLGADDAVHLAEGAWAELHATALDLGLEWPEQRSPREQARRVVGQVSDVEQQAVASLEGLLVEVERGRYGPASPVSTVEPEERSRTVETVESWRKVMLGSVDRERGWRGRLWPVSLLRGSALRRSLRGRSVRPPSITSKRWGWSSKSKSWSSACCGWAAGACLPRQEARPMVAEPTITTKPRTPSQICWETAPPMSMPTPTTNTTAAAMVRMRATRSRELPRRVETNLGSSWASACSICSSRRSSSSESGTIPPAVTVPL
jgi:transglutaminase-like putative cysteine protease